MKPPSRRFLHPLVLLFFLAGGFLHAADPLPTYAEWRAACARLPANRVLHGRMPARALLPLKTFDPVNHALDTFFSLATNGPLSNPTLWLGQSPRRETFLNVHRAWFKPPAIPFEPFAAKLVLPEGARVFLQGDLHGDIHSLLGVLNRLNELQQLDGFNLIDPDLHMVFLGDYTDRGSYGIEVIYTLLRLRMANPDRFHLIRGNHEDVSLVARYGFLAEGQAKFGTGFNAEKLLRFHDFLPVVLYLGSGTNYVQLCHGGMEPGFSPAPLLNAEGTNRFQLLGPLRQAGFQREHPGWLKAPSEAALARSQFVDFTPAAPTTPATIGFLWNDFTVFTDEAAFAHNPDRAWVYGKPAVEYLLRSASQGNARLRAVIRAHQHSGVSNPLMRRLVAGQGVFRHWQEPQSSAARDAEPTGLTNRIETSRQRALPEGSVWTMNVTPDSMYGLGCGFGFATFAVLTVESRFEDWRLTVEPVDVPLPGPR